MKTHTRSLMSALALATLLLAVLRVVVRDAPASGFSLGIWALQPEVGLHLNRLPTVLRCNEVKRVTLQISLVKLRPRYSHCSPSNRLETSPFSCNGSFGYNRPVFSRKAQIEAGEHNMEQT